MEDATKSFRWAAIDPATGVLYFANAEFAAMRTPDGIWQRLKAVPDDPLRQLRPVAGDDVLLDLEESAAIATWQFLGRGNDQWYGEKPRPKNPEEKADPLERAFATLTPKEIVDTMAAAFHMEGWERAMRERLITFDELVQMNNVERLSYEVIAERIARRRREMRRAEIERLRLDGEDE